MLRMLTIAHLITTLERGGAEAMLTKLVCAQASQGVHSVVISLTGPGDYGPELERAGIPVWSLGMRRGIPDPMALVRLGGILRRVQPQLLQTWLYHTDLLGLFAARLTRVPQLCWNIRCSDMDMRHYSRMSRWLIRLLARLSGCPDAVLVNSESGRRFHQELGYRPKCWRVIPNGFDTGLYRPDPDARQEVRQSLGLLNDAPVVGLIARFDPMKDHSTFLAAAVQVAERHPRTQFVLAGRDVVPDNPAFAVANGTLGGRLHLLGPRSDIPRVMAALDLCCLSSAFGEGFPNVVGEAMACGIPCVATDVGDAGWIIGDTGRVVAPGDATALADALSAMVELGAEKRRVLGAAARRRIEEEFSISVIARLYHNVYVDLITTTLTGAKAGAGSRRT